MDVSERLAKNIESNYTQVILQNFLIKIEKLNLKNATTKHTTKPNLCLSKGEKNHNPKPNPGVAALLYGGSKASLIGEKEVISEGEYTGQ